MGNTYTAIIKQEDDW